MGSSEIWDKYHECCIGNGTNFTRQSLVKLPISNTKKVVFQISLLPMLFILVKALPRVQYGKNSMRAQSRG